MGKKLRQVTDNVHGTIYLSEFESKLMSTPFFYRLHDIYQSSTVYLTFPTNRTKRYEHSVGTMKLASDLFFAGMANANSEDRKDFLEQLYKHVTAIADKLYAADIEGVEYLNKVNNLGQVISRECLKKDELWTCIFDSVKNENILDGALEHYAVCFFDTLNGEDKFHDNGGNQIAKYLYIYQAILEAIRVAALFHDVGHPPYSHIIEEVLKEIYTECLKDTSSANEIFEAQKRKELLRCLEVFVTTGDKKSKGRIADFKLLLQKEKSAKKNVDAAIHEQVGLKMLQLAVEDVFPKEVEDVNDSELSASEKAGKVLYYILIVEFTFAILLEKSWLFKSIHRIIDGVIDADRLDYIVRDSQNSGVDWGRIPYKRVIDSAKLVRPNGKNASFFAMAFPQKEQEDLEDILIMRYKIFSRINFHHRTVKTATLLQYAVKELAFDYLKSNEDDEISENIAGLWTALGATLGEKALQVGQWNDSWLITVLYDALIKLSDKNLFIKYVNKQGKTQEMLENIRDLLEEVLLNHKHYYSLFKRKGDLINLANLILEKSKIKRKMAKTKIKELAKYRDSTKTEEQHLEAEESLLRITLFEKFLQEGDFDLFQIIFPARETIILEIKELLEKERKKGKIEGFYVLENKGRNKKGISSSEDCTRKIYLYDSNSEVQEYKGYSTLEVQINSLRSASLGFYVYIKYDTDNKQKILNKIAGVLAKELEGVYDELFPSSK